MYLGKELCSDKGIVVYLIDLESKLSGSIADLCQLSRNTDGSLYAAVTMPSIEVGTVGGGTDLRAQASMLQKMSQMW